MTQRGFCWSTAHNPTIESGNYVINETGGKGEFSDTIKGLQGETTYYIRAYAINGKNPSPSYSDEDSVTTHSGLGQVQTLNVTNRRATTATGGGKIIAYGEEPIISYGVFKALSDNMYNKDTIRSTTGIAADSFLCNLTGLNADTRYYVQAFVTNHFGTYCGKVVEFSTSNGKPVIDSAKVVVVNGITLIGYTEISVISNVLEAGDAVLEKSGFCWSENPMPTIESAVDIPCRTDQTGPITAEIQGLTSQQTYYIRAYAKNAFGTVYSNELVVQTLSDLPSVRTNYPQINNLSGTVALSGQIISSGRSPISAKGFCYSSLTQIPTVSTSTTINIPLSDALTAELSGLKGERTYYFRAYARNNEGVTYGDILTFTTPQVFNGGLAVFPETIPLEASSAHFMIGNRFYLLGGDVGPHYTKNLFSYNKMENMWRKLRHYRNSESINDALKWQAAVGFESSAYVLGGIDANNKPSNDFYQYVLANNTWFSMPKGPDSAYLRVGIAKNDVWMYRILGGGWIPKTVFPIAQYGGMAVRIDNVIYAGMGKNSSGTGNKTLWKSEDDMASWMLETTQPAISNGILAGVTFKQKIYVLDDSYLIHEYDLQTSQWRTKSRLPALMHDIQGMYTLDDYIYISFGNSALVMYNPLWDN